MSDEQGDAVEAQSEGGGDAAADPDERAGDDAASPDDEQDDATREAERDETTADTTDDEDTEMAELREHVEESDVDTLARELAELGERVEDLELELDAARAERDDLEERLQRKQAEFENYKKRQEKRREQVRARATEDLVERLLEVRDNLERALEQDEDADIREGVEATFRQLDETLRGEDVEPVDPEPGAEVDPSRHEVLLTVESDQPPGTVAEVHRSGYEMAGKVLRPAQVTVSDDGDGDGNGDD